MRHGNRQLNKAIHRIALTQTIYDGPGKTYFQRRLADGDSRGRAMRALKRRITRVVYNRLTACRQPATGPGPNSRRSSCRPSPTSSWAASAECSG